MLFRLGGIKIYSTFIRVCTTSFLFATLTKHFENDLNYFFPYSKVYVFIPDPQLPFIVISLFYNYCNIHISLLIIDCILSFLLRVRKKTIPPEWGTHQVHLKNIREILKYVQHLHTHLQQSFFQQILATSIPRCK